MRPFALLALVGLASIASADRWVTIPTARKIGTGTLKLELNSDLDARDRTALSIGTGLPAGFDAEFTFDTPASYRDRGTFNVGYTYIPALKGIAPGVAFGVMDGLDRTVQGVRFYGVATYQPEVTVLGNLITPEASIGLFVGERVKPFFGVRAELLRRVHGLVEFDGDRFLFGGEVDLFAGVRARVTQRDSRTSLGVVARFTL